MVLRGRRDTLEGMDTPAAPDSPDRPDEKKKRVWPFLFAPKWVSWHLLMVVAFFGMLWLGDWQYRRAMSGNALSWAYTFEWPLFAVFAVVFWAKTIRDEFRILRGEIPRVQNRLAAEPDLPLTVAAVQSYTSASTELEVYDPELAAYNAYLSRLNSEVKDHGKWHGLR
jgi:DNA-binding transcriptional regulator of glucitol operon